MQCRGAALPTNTPGIPCIFDPHGRAGICGDWLLGSSLESAALSGMALANHVSATSIFLIVNEGSMSYSKYFWKMQIADYFQSGEVEREKYAVGLQNEFQPLKGEDIGQFLGLESEKQSNEAHEDEYQLSR